MKYPNFLIIGVQKSATSWLSVNLNEHPNIYIERDERHFFNNPRNYKKGILWYLNQFNPPPDATAVGDKTPEYMWVKEGVRERNGHNYHVPELVYKHFPEMKLIVILRDPVERAISAYLYFIRGGEISPRARLHQVAHKFGILEMGCYYEQLLYWKNFFSSDRILVFIKEIDVDVYPLKTLKKCASFLEVDSNFIFPKLNERVNVGWTDLEILISYCLRYRQNIRSKYKKIRRTFHPFFSILRQRKNKTGLLVSKLDYDFLYDYYHKDYEKLENLLGVNLSVWKRK